MMLMDLKQRSRRLIAEAEPQPINVSLVYVALMLLVAFLSAKMFNGLTEAQLQQYLQHITDGNIEYALDYLQRLLPPPSTFVMLTVLQMVMKIVGVGFVIFLLNTVRQNGACFGNLLDGFGFFWKIIIKEILVSLAVALGMLLLFFPGFILFFAYRQTTYIMIDHPEYSVVRCMRESRRMMRGHKAELFTLDLSFFGWYLLMSLPMLGYFVMVWVQPFTGLTYAAYYNRLSGHEEPEPETEHFSY